MSAGDAIWITTSEAWEHSFPLQTFRNPWR